MSNAGNRKCVLMDGDVLPEFQGIVALLGGSWVVLSRVVSVCVCILYVTATRTLLTTRLAPPLGGGGGGRKLCLKRDCK